MKFLTLENGLTIVFYQDKTKHSAVLDLIVKFGGINSCYKRDGKLFKIPDGYAHFLEHLVIEHSQYGNMLSMFLDDNIDFNGLTYCEMTNFYIDTVHDFNKNVVKLLKGINESVFNAEDVEKTKSAVIEEIRENLDNKFQKLERLTRENLFQEISYQDNLGTIEDIKNITYNDIKNCYDAFYRPSNEIVVVSGNFNEERVLDLIKKTYNLFPNDNNRFEIPKLKEPIQVKAKTGKVQALSEEEYVRIAYKVYLNDLDSSEKVKLSFYLKYLLNYNFSTKSNLQKTIVDKKISIYDMDYDYMFFGDFLILEIGTYTNKKNEFIELIKNQFTNLEFSVEDFNLSKKESLISLLLREESLSNMIFPLIDNMIAFSYYDYDKVEDINKQNFEDYQKLIKSLDFSNYTIAEIIPSN